MGAGMPNPEGAEKSAAGKDADYVRPRTEPGTAENAYDVPALLNEDGPHECYYDNVPSLRVEPHTTSKGKKERLVAVNVNDARAY